MNIIAMCTALDKTYLAIKYDEKIYSKTIENDENYHSLYLISKIKEICEKNSIFLNNLDLITVNCGPGSFSGIRVALTIAKTMAGELNLPVVGLNSAQILLNAFNQELLVMDARRDMYYLGNKDEIKLIYKNEIENHIQNKSLLCDRRCADVFCNSICFEGSDKDLGEVMLNLAQEKYLNSKNRDEFNYLKLSANYIQTPPVFC